MLTAMFWLLVFLSSALFAEPLDLRVSGEHVILMNADTAAVLFEKDSRILAHPASTTKIATALYALRLRGHDLEAKMVTQSEAIRSISPAAKVQSKYRSPPYWLETDGTHIGLKRGEEMPFGDLVHAILISSANDACNVVAQTLGGTIPSFMEHLNLYLKKIGCKNTHYNNPHGLTHPEHLTTAEDLAMMAKEALKEPFFCEVMGKTRYTCPETNLEYKRYFIQTNNLLKNGPYFFPQAIGMKTGTTQAAGKNLVAVARENGRTLIGVFMGYRSSADLYSEARLAFQKAFGEQKMRRILLPAGCQNFTRSVPGARKLLQTYLPENLSYDYYPSEDDGYRLLVHWKLPKFPILQGEEVGRLEILSDSHTMIKSAPLYAFNELKPSLIQRIWMRKKFLLAAVAIVFVVLFLRFRKS